MDSKEPKPTLIEKDELNFTISIPLHTKRYPEIIFPLKQDQKNEKIKLEELANAFLDMKKKKDKEIKDLKDRIDELEAILKIKTEKDELKEHFEGTKLEIFNIGKDKYKEFFPDELNKIGEISGIGYTLILECNEKDIADIISAFNNYKKELKKILDIKISNKLIDLNICNDKNKIYISWVLYREKNGVNEENNKKDLLFDEMIEAEIDYFPIILNGLKVKLITDATLIDLFELENKEKINEIVFNTKLLFEGETIKSKILMSFLILLINKYKKEDIGKKFYHLLIDIFLTVINGNYCYRIKNKDMFDNFESDITCVLAILKYLFFNCVNFFKDPKFRVFQKLDFNKIKIGVCGSPKFKIGYLGIKLESLKNNEFVDKVLKGEIKLYEEEIFNQNNIEENDEENEFGFL